MKIVKVAAAIIRKDNQIFATQRSHGNYAGYWEFPGGKLEPGETSQEALIREIQEELDTEVSIDRHFASVEYDYPDFRLNMDCFLCSVKKGHLTLLEHRDAKWLGGDELDSVPWLPADIDVIKALKDFLCNPKT